MVTSGILLAWLINNDLTEKCRKYQPHTTKSPLNRPSKSHSKMFTTQITNLPSQKYNQWINFCHNYATWCGGLSGIFDVSPFNVESVSNGILSMTTKTTMPTRNIYKQCWILFVLFVSNPNAINHYFMWNLRTSFCYQYHNIVIDGMFSASCMSVRFIVGKTYLSRWHLAQPQIIL